MREAAAIVHGAEIVGEIVVAAAVLVVVEVDAGAGAVDVRVAAVAAVDVLAAVAEDDTRTSLPRIFTDPTDRAKNRTNERTAQRGPFLFARS